MNLFFFENPTGSLDDKPRIPPAIFWGVCLFCVLPFLLQLLGADFGSRGEPPPWDDFGSMAKGDRIDSLFYALSGAFTHTILEWSAFTAAIFTVFLAFNHYSITKDITTPVIGVALFCAGCMDAFHTLAADRLIDASAPNTNLIPFTWAVARIFNALIMIAGVSLFLFRKPAETAKQGIHFVLGISVVFGVIGYIIIQYCANSASLPQTQYPDSIIARPYDVVPLVLFLFAGLVVYPMFYRAYPSLFAHALILSAVPEVVVELHMAFGSTALFDSHFNVAHFLKIFAYLVPFLGLSLDYVRTYKKEREHSDALERAHVELSAKSHALNDTIEELQRTNRYKSDFLASMSHELRTPLNSILGFSEILIKRSRGERPEKEMNALKTVHRDGRHLMGLIDDILDLSKIDAGKMSVTKTRLSTHTLLGTIESQLSPMVEKKELKITFNQPLRDILIDSDETKMLQILLNLGSNAIKSTESGQVNVSAQLVEEADMTSTLVISFRDTGIGISEENQKIMFSEFGRADDSKIKNIQGTGLGLLITKRLVELLGGRIELDSVPGEGSEFRIYMPGAREVLDRELADNIEVNPDSFIILTIDDDEDALEYLEMTFEDVGFKVVSTDDPANAISISDAAMPSVICVDLKMPQKDGVELIRELKVQPHLKTVPIIAISGYPERYEEATEAGAESFLVKPCDQQTLISHIQNVVLEDTRTALIVDCSSDDREQVSDFLTTVRMKSFFAENDESAMKKLEEFTPSLLIVDLVNPDSQGLELLGRLAASTNGWAKIPLVILSNTPDNCEAYENLSSHASVVSKENLESSELIISAMKAVTKTNRLLLAEDKAVLNTEIPHNEGETILVVEDTPDNMELFGWILDGESLNYEGVEDGQSALDAVRQKKYDLILMDINLPDINGKDVTRSIRKISAYENTPIIAVTAHAIKTEIEGIMDSGITELVTKPINQTELISVINKHLPH